LELAKELPDTPQEEATWLGIIQGAVNNNINKDNNIDNNNKISDKNDNQKDNKEGTIKDNKNNIVVTTKKDTKGNYKITIKKDIKKDIKIKPPEPKGYHTRLPDEYIAVLDVLKINTGYYKYELDRMAYDLLFKKYGIVIEKE
jgi:hypothetical protein